ncbi:hypothetical protein TWF225_007501 [Orbilia oligospora]|uniref:Uncharacterized protein n=1 Tax=Orbilia oligospora TaxID=2813651 RepID=A0A8H2HVD1_ORBOL|nr:hypothetical protein TWF225_007501 [Orbilia oligospora]KAF3233628.1 hypothetical protein TWF128_002950 [Orbilia oligospora]KAF3252307.1 hypothetical protein TWF217_007838 [Orbilia oligospora]KAF3275471.1 hypothetical protein TWF132_002883 [Orbilia oligospora]TGJ74026.1 hypothetical protein EYR41_001078 [Orbilia oligospora]
MHSSGFIATTAAARGRILPVLRQIKHIWISESLVRNVFRTFTSGRARYPRGLYLRAIKSLKSDKYPQYGRGFHKNRCDHTAHKSDIAGGGASNHRSDGLFSWGSRLEDPPRFDYSRPSNVSQDVRTQRGDGIFRVLGTAKTKIDDENGSPWLFGPQNEILWKHLPSTKQEVLVGFPPQVPYSTARSPSEPWLPAPRDRLSELIEHDNLPPARTLRPSVRRAALVDLQVQKILRDVLHPSINFDSQLELEPSKPNLDTNALLEGNIGQSSRGSLGLIPYSLKQLALVITQMNPDLQHAEIITSTSQFSQSEEHADVRAETLAGSEKDGLRISTTSPNMTSAVSASHTTEPIQFEDVEVPVSTNVAQTPEESSSATAEVDALAGVSEDELVEYTEQPPAAELRPALTIEDSPAVNISFDFLETIHWEGVRLPLQPPKILLPKEQRLDVSSVPKLEDIQYELFKLAADKSTSLESRILIYSQIDTIYGIENLPDPKSFFDVFLPGLSSKSGTISQDVMTWISAHKSISRLQGKRLLPDGFLENQGIVKPPNKAKRAYSAIIDDPFRNPDISIHRSWALAKAHIQRAEKISTSNYHFLPFTTVRIFLEKIIKLLHSGAWNSVKGQAVMSGLDIFKYCFEVQQRYPFLLFLELARFLMAWKRHWTTREFLDDIGKGGQNVADDSSSVAEPSSPDNSSLPDIPGLDEFFRVLPREYIDRLVCTLMLHAIVHSSEPLSEAHYLRKIMPFSRKYPMADLMKTMYRDGGYLPFLKDPSLYDKRIALEGPFSTARFLQGRQDIDIISFHLRTWPALHGVRYIDDKELFDRVQEAMEDIISRVQARILKDSMDCRPRAPGLPFAQAILSLFYLNLPTEGIIVGIFLALAHSKKTHELKSCLNILSHFEGKYNGQVKFKIPKQCTSIALKCFREHHLPWALDLLMNYHNRHNKTFANVILEAADKYPKQAAIVFEHFLKPLHVTSLWNPQISFRKPAGWPSKWFLRELALKYALSNHHYPTTATRRIIHLRYLYRRYGYGVSMHITRALVATAMIRTATHRLWAGRDLKATEDLFKHERLKYAISVFMKDADQSPTYLAGLTNEQAAAKKRGFVEKCIKEVWEEIFKWKKYQFALATEKRNRTKGII